MRKVLAIASLALALAGQAHAADLYVPDQPVEAPVTAPVPAAGGWYLRGDVSYDFMNLRGAKYFKGSNALVDDFDTASVDNTGNIGLGVGYQVNDYLRVDTTFDYNFSADFHGSTHGKSNDGSVCDDGCKSHDTSAMTAYSLMANAYVDIAHYGLFTPYVGAGLGGTYVKWDDLKNTSCSTKNPQNCDDTVTHNGRAGWRFTYALMAGTAIDINCNLKADVGYRFRHVTGGDMFGYELNGGPGSDKGFNIHEARAGLRYAFDNGDCAPAYVPPADMPQQQQPVFK
jgi:opacity protein-like surface antigen